MSTPVAKDSDAPPEQYPYLQHVKTLSVKWPHLRALASFMEGGDIPGENQFVDLSQASHGEDRVAKIEVVRLDYTTARSAPKIEAFGDIHRLRVSFEEGPQVDFRLYVIEDLSRDVIEALGTKLEIEPDFFRDHLQAISLYGSFTSPKLRVVRERQRWCHFQYVHARYFRTEDSFKEGLAQSNQFSLRREPQKESEKISLNGDLATLSLTQSQASYWYRDDESRGSIGVLLLDPTMRAGCPLKDGHKNWEPLIKLEDAGTAAEKYSNGTSTLQDFLYWAQRPGQFNIQPTNGSLEGTSALSTNKLLTIDQDIDLPPYTDPQDDPGIFRATALHALHHVLSPEWLVITNYIHSSLSTIEQTTFESTLKLNLNTPLVKLQVWQRRVHVYRSMLEQSLQNLENLYPQIASTLKDPNGTKCQQPAILIDFQRALTTISNHQSRIDRLHALIASRIAIHDTRREAADKRRIAQLSILATIFVPLGATSALFRLPYVLMIFTSFSAYFLLLLPITLGVAFFAWLKIHGAGMVRKPHQA